MSRRSHPRRVAALAILGVMTMTACGDEQPARPGATSPPTATASPTTRSADAALESRAKSRFLPDTALGSGWRLSQPPQPGFGLSVCGVDIEPEEPLGSARRRWAQSPVGPFLAQYVQAHRAGMADEVVARLRSALPSCSSFESRGESPTSPTVRFTLDRSRLDGVPDNAVAWRMTSQGERKVTQDLALVADGEFLIGFVSYGAGDPPDPSVISAALAALPPGD